MKKSQLRNSLLAVSALSASIAVHLQAAPFTSVQSGDWGDPLSWNVVAAGFPDVYGADSAIISATHILNYDGSIPTIGGNLVVANGNSITINGGTLTQTWAPGAPPPFGTAIAIGVSGLASGTGTLNINAAGTFDSGTANAVAVGITSSALGGAVGNGTVNLNDGTFRMGAASSAPGGQGLAIGIDTAAVGVFNLGNGAGAADTALLDLLTNNSLLTIGGRLAEATGGTGTLTIKADGRLNQGTASINVGDDLGTGTLDVQGGTLQGGGGALLIGADSGNGTLTMSAGLIDRVGANHDLVLGNGLGSTGTFTQSGGTLDLHGGHLQVGEGGAGTYNITAGTVSNAAWIHIGSGVGSVGTMDVNFTNPADVLTTGQLYLGNGGATGTTNVTNGSLRVTGLGEVGRYGGTGTLNVTGANSSVEAFTDGSLDGFFTVGGQQFSSGNGTVNITAGGQLNTNGGWFTMGQNDGSVGETTVSGAGSTLTSRGLIVGWSGSGKGTLNIENNAVVTNTVHELSIGRDHSNTEGYVNIMTGGVLNAGPETRIGHNGIGVVKIDGGTLNMQGGAWAILGEGGAANGSLTMTSGAVNVTADRFVLGQNAGSVGTFTQTGGATEIGNELNVGRGGGTGTLNVDGGTFNVNGWTTLGRDGNGTGTINVRNGGVYTHNQLSGDLLLGWNPGSHGHVNVENGGKMTHNWWLRMGIDGGSYGSLKVDGAGSVFKHNDGTGGDSRFYVGESGTGELTVSNSGQLIHGGTETRVGWHNAGIGTVAVNTGGILTLNNGSFLVGNEAGSIGTVDIKTGGKISVNNGWLQIAEGAGSTGTMTVDGTGSLFEHDLISAGHSTSIGQAGTGSLTITNGANYIDKGSRFLVGRDSTGNGTLRVTNGSTLTHLPAVDPNAEDWMMIIGGTHEFVGGGTGLMIVSGGSAVQTNSIDIGRSSAGGGILNLSNSAMTASGHFSTGRGTNGVGGSTNGLVNLTSATLQYGSWLSVGHEGGSGVMNITNSTITGSGDFNVGIDQNGAPTPTVGVVNMNGGTVTVPTMPIGRNGGTGTFNLNSGDVFVSTETNIGNGAGATGTLNISGPASVFNTPAQDGNPRFFVGRGGGHGVVNVMNFGTLNTTNQWFSLGNGDGSLGEATVSGSGTLNSDGLIVGWSLSGVGNLTVSNNGVVNNINRELSVGRDHSNTSGTVTISSGGTLNTVTPRIGHNGIGVVNITNGSLIGTAGDTIIGDGAAANGTVTMSGTSTFRSADHFYVGNAGRGTYTQNGGFLDLGVLANRRIQIGNQGGSTGTFNITGGTVSVSQWIHVGAGAGSTGTLNVNFTNPAGVLPTNDLYLGNGDSTGVTNVDSGTLRMLNKAEVGRYGGTGTLNVTGPNSVVEAFTNGALDGFFKVGGEDVSAGHGIVNVTAGGKINTNGGWFTLGQTNGSVGEATITGAGSMLTSSGLIVGWSGSGVGTLDISDDAVVNNSRHEVSVGRDFNAGDPPNSPTGTINITSGGVLNAGLDLRIGHNSRGVVNMDAGTLNGSGNWAIIGDGGTANGTLNMTNGSVWNNNTGRIYIGRVGIGAATLSGGSSIVFTNADQFNIAGNEGSDTAAQGTLTVDATSSVITNNMLRVGFGVDGGGVPSTGTVNLNGGTITSGQWIGFGHEGGDGTLNMIGGTVTAATDFYVGVDDNGKTRTTTGTATIADGSISAGSTVWIGRGGGTGEVTVTGTLATSLTSANTFNIGDGGIGSGGTRTTGTLTIDNPLAVVSSVNEFVIGRNGGLGTVNQSAGSLIETNQWLSLGVGAGSTGTYNLTGGTVTSNFVEVGADGTGTFNIGETGSVAANQFTVGTRAAGTGTVTVTVGGLVTNSGTIFLGGDQGPGSGTLNILGGTVQTLNVIASLGTASLTLDEGTLRAGANEADFLRGFTDSGGHSAINLLGAGGTVDTNGFDVRVTAANVIAGTDALLDGLAGTVLNKTGLGTLTLESAVGTGFLSVHALQGTLDFEASQTLDALVIDSGATVTVSAPFTPPSPAAADGAGLLAGSTVQGVPEPGSLSLLLFGACGLLGRRRRR